MLTDEFLKKWGTALLPISTNKPVYLVSLASIPSGNVEEIIRPEIPLWTPKPNDGLQTPPGYFTLIADRSKLFGCTLYEVVPRSPLYVNYRTVDQYIPRGVTPRINYGLIGSIIFVPRDCGYNSLEDLVKGGASDPKVTSEVRTVYMYFDSYICGQRVATPEIEVQATLMERRHVYGDVSHRMFSLLVYANPRSASYPWYSIGSYVFPLWLIVPFLDVRGMRTMVLDNIVRAVTVYYKAGGSSATRPIASTMSSTTAARKTGTEEKKSEIDEKDIAKEISLICSQSKSPLCNTAKPTVEDLFRLQINAMYTMPLFYFLHAYIGGLKARDVYWYLEALWDLLVHKRSPTEHAVLAELEMLEVMRPDTAIIKDLVARGLVESEQEEGEEGGEERGEGQERKRLVPWALRPSKRVLAALELIWLPKFGQTFVEQIRDYLAFVDKGPLDACRNS